MSEALARSPMPPTTPAPSSCWSRPTGSSTAPRAAQMKRRPRTRSTRTASSRPPPSWSWPSAPRLARWRACPASTAFIVRALRCRGARTPDLATSWPRSWTRSARAGASRSGRAGRSTWSRALCWRAQPPGSSTASSSAALEASSTAAARSRSTAARWRCGPPRHSTSIRNCSTSVRRRPTRCRSGRFRMTRVSAAPPQSAHSRRACPNVDSLLAGLRAEREESLV